MPLDPTSSVTVQGAPSEWDNAQPLPTPSIDEMKYATQVANKNDLADTSPQVQTPALVGRGVPYQAPSMSDVTTPAAALAEMLYGAGKGAVAGTFGVPGDINSLLKEYVQPKLPQPVQNVLQSLPAPNTSNQIVNQMPTTGSQTENAATWLGQNVLAPMVGPEAIGATKDLPIGLAIKDVGDVPSYNFDALKTEILKKPQTVHHTTDIEPRISDANTRWIPNSLSANEKSPNYVWGSKAYKIEIPAGAKVGKLNNVFDILPEGVSDTPKNIGQALHDYAKQNNLDAVRVKNIQGSGGDPEWSIFNESYLKPPADPRAAFKEAAEITRTERQKNLEKFLEPSVDKKIYYHKTEGQMGEPIWGEKTYDEKGRPEYNKPIGYSIPDHSEVFDQLKGSDQGSINLTPSIEFANEFKNERGNVPSLQHPHREDYEKSGLIHGSAVYPVHVRVTNPFDYENPKHIRDLNAWLRADPDTLNFYRAKKWQDFNENVAANKKGDNWSALESGQIQKYMRERDYDSFYKKENGVKNLSIFSPNQVKSVYGNEGRYDINSPLLHKASGGIVKTNTFDPEEARRQIQEWLEKGKANQPPADRTYEDRLKDMGRDPSIPGSPIVKNNSASRGASGNASVIPGAMNPFDRDQMLNHKNGGRIENTPKIDEMRLALLRNK